MNLGHPGVKAVSSFTPREFMQHYQDAVIDAGLMYSAARDVFGGTDSCVIRAGTVLGFISASKVYTPIKGAEAASPSAVGSQVVFVNCVAQFAVGDNIKVGKAGARNLPDEANLVQDLGAALSVYTTSKTITVAADTKIISAIVAGDYVYVEPATADGSADGVAILLHTIKITDDNGSAQDTEIAVVKAGFVKTKQLLGLTARAKLQLAGFGQASPKSMIRFNDNA